MNRLGNALFFYATWFVAVVPAGRGLWWPGVVGVLAFALLQLRDRDTRTADLKLVALAAALGFALDTAFVATGLLTYAAPWPSPRLAPAWIVALWIGLALAINHSLRWVKPYPWLAALLGAASAPVSYLAARKFDAVAIATSLPQTLAIVAVAWAIVVWMLVVAARGRVRVEEQPCPL